MRRRTHWCRCRPAPRLSTHVHLEPIYRFSIDRNFVHPWNSRALTAPTESPIRAVASSVESSANSGNSVVLRSLGVRPFYGSGYDSLPLCLYADFFRVRGEVRKLELRRGPVICVQHIQWRFRRTSLFPRPHQGFIYRYSRQALTKRKISRKIVLSVPMPFAGSLGNVLGIPRVARKRRPTDRIPRLHTTLPPAGARKTLLLVSPQSLGLAL